MDRKCSSLAAHNRRKTSFCELCCEVALKKLLWIRWLHTFMLGIAALSLGACTSASNPATNTPTAEVNTPVAAYPGAYPAPIAPVATSTNPYPPPPYSDLPEGPQFTINQPVRLSNGQVTGTGPAGIPIRIVNITRGAIELATVTIGADGTFSAPLRETFVGDRIAIMLGDISGTGLDRNQFIRGPGYEDWPLIGILFASAIVEE